MRSLYDVSCLIALLDRNHDDHAIVSAWFSTNSEKGWASCPLTQNGYLRIRSQSRYPHPLSLTEAFEQLWEATSASRHQFIPDDVSLLDNDLVLLRDLPGHRQLTDVYLLALAVAHDARMITLDTHIPLTTVTGATEEHLVVI